MVWELKLIKGVADDVKGEVGMFQLLSYSPQSIANPTTHSDKRWEIGSRLKIEGKKLPLYAT